MIFKGTHVRISKRRSWTVPDGGKGLQLPSTNGGLRARKRAREREEPRRGLQEHDGVVAWQRRDALDAN